MKDKVLSISQLSTYIKGVFEDELFLHNICVYGEVYEYNVSGNVTYITLKEGDFTVNCIKFGLIERLELGASIAVTGSVNYFSKANRISVQIKSFEYYGEGKIIKDFENLKATLKAEGIFEKSVPLPSFIQKVAVITSLSGAVIYDFISVIRKYYAFVDICICGVKVQGDGSSDDMVKMLRAVCKSTDRPDLIVLARGGGANSDLAAFNDEKLARETALCGVPVISAVGHETDYTLTDNCASYRAGTPSIAAEKIVQINAAYLNGLINFLQKISFLAESKYVRNEKKLLRYAYYIQSKSLERCLYYENSVIKCGKMLYSAVVEKHISGGSITKDYLNRLLLGVTSKAKKADESLRFCLSRLHDLNPLKIFSLGYCKILKGEKIIRSVKTIKKGDQIKIWAVDGNMDACVEKVKVTEKGENHEV